MVFIYIFIIQNRELKLMRFLDGLIDCLIIISATFITSKHIHSTTQVHLFFFFLFLLFFCGSLISAASTSTRGSCELARIGQIFLVNISLVKGEVITSNRDGEDNLEGIGNAVGNTGFGGNAESEGEGCNHGASFTPM